MTSEDIAKTLYAKFVADIVSTLENQEGMRYENALLDIGYQVVNGWSIYEKIYRQTIDALSVALLEDVSVDELILLWQDVSCNVWYTYNDDTEDDDSFYSMEGIMEEIFHRVCSVAEEAYYEYQEE